MTSGGRTNQVQANEVSVGRQILCKEDPKTPASSACAKQLTSTIDAAKKGLTADQQKVWREMVYTPAVLQVARFAGTYRGICGDWDIACLKRNAKPLNVQAYLNTTQKILSGTSNFSDLFGVDHTWSDYLTKGAELIKKLPQTATCPPGQAMNQSGKCYTPGGDPAGSPRTPEKPPAPKECKPGFKKNDEGRCVRSAGVDYT